MCLKPNQMQSEEIPSSRLTYLVQRDEGKTKRLHLLAGVFGVEDHAVRGQVDATFLLALEGGPVLAGKLDRHIVAEDENAERK